MSDLIPIPDPAEVGEMSPDEYEEDLKERYYNGGYDTHSRVQRLIERIEILEQDALELKEDAQEMEQKAEQAREDARTAAAEGEDERYEDLLDKADRLEQKANRTREKARAKSDAAGNLEETELPKARTMEEEERTDALRSERKDRLKELMEVFERFEDAFRKAEAADRRAGQDGNSTVQSILSNVDMNARRANGAQTTLGRQLRRKVGQVLDELPA